MDMDKIAVLIPCYNEEKTIGKVVRDAKAALPEADLVVDSRLCAGVTPEKHAAALETMRSCQIDVK